MPSSINASTTTGLVSTADLSGVLNIQTAGTTALTISAAQASTFASTVTGTALIPSGSSVPTDGVYLPAANIVGFSTNSTERMRLNSSGYLLVGCTGLPSTSVAGAAFSPSVTSVNPHFFSSGAITTSVAQISFVNGTGTVGQIATNGGATSYATSSDYRLKENVLPMTGALATVSALKPCTYKWKASGLNGQGFIAHELQAVIPECVVGEKDAVNEDGSIKAQGIDTSFLVATLTAAIQELNAKVDAQAAEIAALKAGA